MTVKDPREHLIAQLDEKVEASDTDQVPTRESPPHQRKSTGADLLKHAGTWVGDDLEDLLAEVYATRSRISFETWEDDMVSARRPTSGADEELDEARIHAVAPGDHKPYSGPDSTGASLLELLDRLPRWAGDDLDDLLDEVKRMRGETEF